MRPTPVHPALRERGRAIVTPSGGAAPSPSPSGPFQASAPFVQRGPMEGRVWSSPLNVYYIKDEDEVRSVNPPFVVGVMVVPHLELYDDMAMRFYVDLARSFSALFAVVK